MTNRRLSIYFRVGPEGDGRACCPSVLDAPLDPDAATELAAAFAALADPARLRLLSLIAAQPEGEVCACDLVEPLGKSQPTVSHHLKVLREAGLIEGDKRGTWVWYRVVPGAVADLERSLAGHEPTASSTARSSRATA